MIGLLFSGQGSLKTGITQDIYQQVPEYRQTIDKASEILQLDIGKLMFDEQKATQLLQTQYSQPVILSISLGLYQILKPALSGHKLVGMGLSLGEYSALACSGYLDFSSALKVIKRRGELMQQASEQIDSKMVAILKADLTAVQQACQKAQKKGIVSIANVNTPDQIVIGGQNQAVDYAIELLTAEKSLRVVELKVSGAFHTPIMHSIQAGLKQTLAPINWQEGDFEVISTTTQKPFAQSNLTANLTQQLVSTTYFAQTFQKVASQLEAVIEIGPGHTLLGFVKKIDKQIPRYSVDSLETLRQTQQLLGV